MTSIGRIPPENGDDQALGDDTENGYVEFFIRDGRLVGAILIVPKETLGNPLGKRLLSN